MTPLLAAVCVIGFILAPVMNSAATATTIASDNIPLFDPANYTVEQLNFNSLNDGIPDVWKLHYGLSVIDPSVASADYTGSGIMNAEKYQLNLHPLEPAPTPELAKTVKAPAPKISSTAVKGAVAANPPSNPRLLSNDFLHYYGYLGFTHLKSKAGYYPLSFYYNWVREIGGWTAFQGTGVEVWRPFKEIQQVRGVKRELNGEQFVELNARKGNYGIKQKITDAKAGAYILTWRDTGRKDSSIPPKTLNSPYKVYVYAKKPVDDQKGNAGKREGSIEVFTSKEYQGPDAWQNELVVFSVTEDVFKTHPNIWIAFVPTNTMSTYGALVDKICLAPVEVVQPKLDTQTGYIERDALGKDVLEAVTEVRFCRWQDAFYASFVTPKTDFIDKDKDRFVIRIPASIFPIQNKITAQVATKRPQIAIDKADTVENSATPEEFTRTGDYFESKPMILVPDEEDTVLDSVTPGDPTSNDRKLMATPGGKIEVSLSFQGSPKFTLDIKPYTQKIIVETYVVHSPSVIGQLPPYMTTEIEKQMSRAKAVFKQVHVKVEHRGPYNCDIGDVLMREVLKNRGDGQNIFLVHNPSGKSLHDEGKQVFDKILGLSGANAASKVVRIVFFPCVGIDYDRNILGITVRSDLGQTLFGKYEGFIAIQTRVTNYWRIAAHEIGHTINLEHRPRANVDRCMLMIPIEDETNYGSMIDEYEVKRFHPFDLDKIDGVIRSPFLQKK